MNFGEGRTLSAQNSLADRILWQLHWPGMSWFYNEAFDARVENSALYDILKIVQMRQQTVGTRDVDYGQE